MSLSAKVAKNTIVQIASKAVSTILGLIAIAIMTRYLGTEGFGQYTTIITFLSFFSIAADFGLTLVTAQMISVAEANQNKILNNLFGFRLATAAILLGICPVAVLFFPYGAEIKIGVAIASLAFFFVALNQVFVGLFQKNLKMEKVSIAELAGRIILISGLLAVLRFDYGLNGIMVVSLISSAINFLLHFFFSKKYAEIKFAYDKEIWAEIYKKSWPIAITIVFNLIYLKTDTLILSLIKTQTDVGIYGAAYRVIDVLITIPFMFAGIILPIITLSYVEKNMEQFRKVFQRSFDFLAIIALPLIVGAQFTAKPIMIFVAGKDFGASGDVLKVLIIAAGIIFLGSIFSHAIIAINKQKQIISAYIFTSIISVIGYLFFIPRYSYFGAAWMTVWSELSIAFAAAYLIRKNTGIFPNLKIFFKSSIASLFMGLIIFLLNKTNIGGQNLPVILTAGLTSYLISLYLLGGISKNEFKKLLT